MEHNRDNENGISISDDDHGYRIQSIIESIFSAIAESGIELRVVLHDGGRRRGRPVGLFNIIRSSDRSGSDEAIDWLEVIGNLGYGRCGCEDAID